MGFIFNDPKFIIGTNDIPSPIQMLKSFVIGGAVNEPTWQDVVISGVGALTLVNAKADSLNYVKMLGETRVNGVPNGYTQLEYLQSNGTQYINTGFVIPDLTHKYVLHMRMTVDGGTQPSASQNVRGYQGANGVLSIAYTQNYGLGSSSDGVPVIANHIYDITHTRYADTSRNVVIDDTTITNNNQSTAYDDRPYCIFNLSPLDTNYFRMYGKIYEFQAYKDDVIQMNLVPCRRNSDDVLGMYDTVTGDFLTNAGTGTFTAGSDVVPTTDNPMDIYINNGIVRTFGGNKFTKVGQTTGVLLSSTGVAEPNSYYNTTDYIFLKAGNYTVQWQDTASGNRMFKICSYYDNDSFRALVFSKSSPGTSLNTYTFTISYDTRVRISYRTSFSRQSVKPTETIYYLDNPVTETVTDSLNNTATVVDLYGIGNYKDSHEILTGNINQNVGIYAVRGTEEWTLAGTTGADGSKRIWLDFSTKDANVGLSNMFTIAPLASRDEEGMNNRFFMSGTTLHLRSDKFTSLADAKTWLANQYSAGTPVLVVYALKTPTSSSTTAQTLNVAEGENTITITQASLPDLPLEVSYIAGVRVTVTEVENANLDNQVTVTIT